MERFRQLYQEELTRLREGRSGLEGCRCEIFPGASSPLPRPRRRRMRGSIRVRRVRRTISGARGMSFPRNRAAFTLSISR